MEKKDIKGSIICFDGIDGCGKTSQISLVGEYLEDKGYKVLYLRQPGIPGCGETIREALFSEKINGRVHDFWSKRLLFIAEYREFVDRYRSDDYKDIVILCDRCMLSSNPVYGGAELGDMDEVLKKTVPLYEDLADKAPDLIVLFNADLHKSIERLEARKEGNYYDRESLEFKKNCIQNLSILGDLEEMNPYTLGLETGSYIFRDVDANGNIDETFNNTIKLLEKVFNI